MFLTLLREKNIILAFYILSGFTFFDSFLFDFSSLAIVFSSYTVPIAY